jgi:hypothetical protein
LPILFIKETRLQKLEDWFKKEKASPPKMG